MTVLQTLAVSRTFGQGATQVVAVRDVDLSVTRAEFVAIMGPSGCGKSTLLHLLAGIETPSSGQVLLEDQDLAQMDDEHRSILRRRRIGFVFQRINLLPTLNAVENVALPLRLDGVPKRTALDRAKKALADAGVAHRETHRPGEMSGGEAQRVAIARAIVIQPAVILGDEPTGALDTNMGRHVVELFRRLATEQSQTIVVVTHDPSVAAEADRIIYMRDGVIVDEPMHAAQEELPTNSRGERR
jgi:putative ABC transport system ATP-binding protein